MIKFFKLPHDYLFLKTIFYSIIIFFLIFFSFFKIIFFIINLFFSYRYSIPIDSLNSNNIHTYQSYSKKKPQEGSLDDNFKNNDIEKRPKELHKKDYLLKKNIINRPGLSQEYCHALFEKHFLKKNTIHNNKKDYNKNNYLSEIVKKKKNKKNTKEKKKTKIKEKLSDKKTQHSDKPIINKTKILNENTHPLNNKNNTKILSDTENKNNILINEKNNKKKENQNYDLLQKKEEIIVNKSNDEFNNNNNNNENSNDENNCDCSLTSDDRKIRSSVQSNQHNQLIFFDIPFFKDTHSSYNSSLSKNTIPEQLQKESLDFTIRLKKGIAQFPNKKIPCKIIFTVTPLGITDIIITSLEKKKISPAYYSHIVSILKRTPFPLSLTKNISLEIII